MPGGPLGAEDGKVEVFHLTVQTRPERLDVRRHAEAPEPRDVVRVDDLEVSDVMAVVGWAVRAESGLGRIQALSGGPVPDRVEVHLEPFAIEPNHRSPKGFGLDEAQPARDAAITCSVEVRAGHRRREVLHDAVLHDLDRPTTQPSQRAGMPELH